MATSIAAPSLQNLLVNTWTNVYSAAPVAGFTGTVRVVVEVGSGSLKLSNSSTGVTNAAGYGDLYDGSASSIAFEGNLTQVNDALQSLQAYNSDANASPTLKISAVKGGPAYNPVNGHYYEYIDYTAKGLTDKTWTGAQGYAANSGTKFNGLQGYLVTITSQQENDFIVGKVGGNAWIGANDAAVEGTWRWVTGPEAGTLIMTEPGDGANPIDSESPFYSWQTGEPNDGGGTEDYAQLISSGTGGLVAGRWNDLVNTGGGEQYTVTGFVIEYGGYSDDNPTEVARTTTTTLTIQATPVITSNGGGDSATVSYAENGNSAITTVTASDADTGDSKTYSITGGADAALFNINSTGALTFKDSPNYEAPSDNGTDNSYEVKVRVTDSSGLSDEQTLTVNVTDVNDNAPVFTSGGTGTVTENAATSTVIYDAATTDADSTGANQAVAYSLKWDGSASDAELLTINSSTGEVTLKASANFEAKNSYAFTVVATNAGTGATLVTEQAVSVSVTDVNETPAIAAGGSTAFTEQTPTAVAPAITLSDDDGNWVGGTLMVQITGNPSGDDSLILPTTNPGGSGIWLDVIGGNLLMSGTTQIGTANGSSANGGAPFPWVFTFDSNATNDLVQDVARAVQLTNSSNDPTTTARTVTFTATDAANATASAIQTVTVTPVNDAPQVSNRVDPAVMYTEDGAAVCLFSDVVVSTVESGQSITGMTFTVSNVSDATEFLNVDGQPIALTQGNTGTTTATGVTYSVSVNAGTSTLSLSKAGGATPEETAALINGITYSNSSQNPSTTLPRAVTLTSMTDSGGSATATLSLTSTVTLVAVNDAPSDIALSGTTIALGDTAQRIEVGTISVTDLDNVAHTLTLGGSDAALFEVEDGKLYLKAGTPLNPTAKPNFSVSLTADDGAAVNNTYTKDFTIGITENVAPVVSVAAVNGSQLTLVFQDSSRLEPTKVPAISAFTVSGGYTVSAVSVPDDATKTVILTLDAAPSGDITVGYTQPDSEANRLQDALGNLVASFANQAVINGSVDTSTATISVPNGGTVPAPLGDFTLINDSDTPAVVSGLRDGQTVTLSGSGPAQISDPAGSLTVANTGSGTVTVDGLNTGSTLTTTGSGPTSVTNPDGNLSIVNNGSGTVTVNGLNPDATLSTGGTGAIDLVGPEGNLILNNTGSGAVTVYGLQNGAALNVTTGTQPINVDLSHLTSGQSITIDNDGSGVVHVFNVPEGVTVSFTGAGPGNSAPTISGIPAAAQAVVAGAAAALADFAVADANADNTLLVTLTANNGAIGGLTDNDAHTPGIQLTGSAAAINSTLANATFTASNAGPASLAINVTDGVFARPTTATYSLTAAPAPAPEPDDPPAPAPAPAPIPPQNQWPNLPDGDGDGVPQLVEARVPSLVTSGSSAAPGDGNGDGIADTAQSDVSSAAFRATDAISQNPQAPVTFVTLVSNSLAGKPVGSTAITQMSQVDAPAGLPAVMEAPLGLLAFTAGVINVGDSGSFSLYVDPGLGVNGFWRQDANGTWVNLASKAYGGGMVEEGGRLRLDFVIEDGGAFDADGAANGFVSAPGAVGSMPLSLAEHQPVVENDGFWF
ncbi:cadherin domain-containing protein [Hydrogenophaga atypica]|uniref:Cadherin domain-containing protein n=1 Tax=Hydrogenophaga atypica TaxID=249409 RepID=A0ABW2QPJ3_9BURK